MKFSTAGLAICGALLVVACGTTPRKVETQAPVAVVESQTTTAKPGSGGYLPGDGPGASAPVNIDDIPDAVPHSEPLHPYANRQYAALGKLYIPLTAAGNYKERGIASWYGKKFHGQRTSSGETYDMYAMTAAHPTLPIPSYARVTNLGNGKSVVVRINDRGPFLHDRIIDLSYAAAYKLGIVNDGSAEVEVESIATDAAQTAPVAAATPLSSTTLQPSPPSVVAAVAMTAASAGASAANAAPSSSTISTALAASGNVYLQLGAFRFRQGAENFLAKMRNELGDAGKQLVLFEKDGLVRVHYGPYPTKDEARAVAERLQGQLGFKPIVSEH